MGSPVLDQLAQAIISPILEFQSLRFAVAAADLQSFRRAALAAGVEQSVLSRHIRRLEDSIGVSIFERHSGGVRLTHAGEVFVRAIRNALRELDDAIVTAGLAGRGECGVLSIGLYTSLSAGGLRSALFEYVTRYPGVRVNLFEASTDGLLASLETKAIDVIFSTAASQPASIEDSMTLWDEQVMVALSSMHPLARRDSVSWSDLYEEPWLLMRRDPGPELLQELRVRAHASNRRLTVTEYDVSLDNLLGLVAAGLGITLVYQSATGGTCPDIVYREIHGACEPSRVRYVAAWKNDNDNPALRRFLSLLRERYPSRFSVGMIEPCACAIR